MNRLPYRWCLGLLLLVLVATNLIENWLLPDGDVLRGLIVTAVLVGLAWWGGLTAAELGLARASWATGLRWGMAGAALVVGGYAIALAIPTVRTSLTQDVDTSATHALATALLVIPLATVIPEELAFRGLLWGLLRRQHGTTIATVVSSLLFGLWHVLPALGGGAANDAVIDVVGDGAVGTTLRVLGTVLFTAGAGMVFCELRRRSDSLLAPILLHWAVNGVGVIAVLVA